MSERANDFTGGHMVDGLPEVEQDWCIGCGVCVSTCPTGAAGLSLRPEKTGELPATNFRELHERIHKEKGL